MKFRIISSLLPFALLFLASCEKEIKMDMPPYESRLVVNSISFAGDVPEVYVSKSVGMTEYNYNKKLTVPNATVVLYTGNAAIDTLTYNAVSGGYTGKVVAEAGKSYKVVVDAPGMQQISATTVVPSAVSINKINRFIKARLSGDGVTQDEIRFTFDDPAASNDYYILSIAVVDTVTDSTVYIGCVNTTDASVESVYDESIDNNTCLSATDIFFRDELFNGKTREMRFFIDSKYMEQNSGASLVVNLNHVPESFFRYRKSYLFASENSGNPFSEPVSVYTNVAGGYGIFSIINTDYRIVN